jgi:hypothetical protein
MGTRNQLAVRGDQVLGRVSFSRVSEVLLVQFCAGKTGVIQPFEQHNVRHARKRRGVPVKTSQAADTKAGTDTGAVAQQPVANGLALATEAR